MLSGHSVVDVPVDLGGSVRSLPFLILDPGEVSLLALAWARHRRAYVGISPSAIQKEIAAIGLFHDFYILIEKGRVVSAETIGHLLARFHDARLHGQAELGWLPVAPATAKNDVRWISEYTEWGAHNFGHIPANPKEERLVSSLNLREQFQFYRALQHRKGWDKLAHLIPATNPGRGVVRRSSYKPPNIPRPRKLVKHFPPSKVLQAISLCPSVRDKLYLLLLFFAGLRLSEPLHLFVSDVTRNVDGEAVVKLAHPTYAEYKWNDEFRGPLRSTREGFLKSRYDLIPRCAYEKKHPLHAGWKGMDLESTNGEVTWLVPEMGRYFYQLHAKYMVETRRHVQDSHPYYFVNENENEFGRPATYSNMRKAFYRAARRVGLISAEDGVNPHGARHFFGFYCATELGLDIKTTQVLLRHGSLMSTQVYYNLSRDAAYRALRKGQAHLAASLSPFIQQSQRLLEGVSE